MTLECDSIEVSEAVGELEICARLSEGDLATTVAINLNTMCVQACSEGGEYINIVAAHE